MKISVVHATRRPAKALDMRKLWLDAAEKPDQIDWTFGIDDDDAQSLSVLAQEPHNISQAGGGCVRAYNETAAKTEGQIIVCASDDVYPIKSWDRIICERIGDVSQPKVLAVSDGRPDPRAIPVQILTRAWIEKHGSIFHPTFKSMYADLYMYERARRDGGLIEARDLIFEHRNPLLGTGEMDEVYEAENAAERYTEGWKTYRELLGPEKISLCMICGNEESIILKCLESAKDAFDELCLVRAIGSRTPDATMQLAQVWCEKNGKVFRSGEYINQVSFPHVDNFGAARQKSFDLATGDWWLWLDCDDYLDLINCQRIREAVKSEHDALYCTYKVEAQGGEILRERLIRRGFGRWKNAIHETCVISGRPANCPQIVVYHSDHKAKHTSSAGRNAAILEGVLEDTPRHYFYYQAELKALGRKEEALAASKIALQLLKPNQVEELYIVRLNLSELEPDKTRDHLLEAVKLQPHRREALAYLCQKSIIDGLPSDAVSYFRLMDALPLPSPLPWTHQGLWYGWARNLLRVRVLRLCGQNEQADKEHVEHMKDPEYAQGVKE